MSIFTCYKHVNPFSGKGERDVVAIGAENLQAASSDVFVGLELQLLWNGDLDVSLAGHLGPVGDAGEDVILREARISLEDVCHALAGGEEIQDEGHPDPMSADARLSETYVRVNRDAGQ